MTSEGRKRKESESGTILLGEDVMRKTGMLNGVIGGRASRKWEKPRTEGGEVAGESIGGRGVILTRPLGDWRNGDEV